MLESKKTSGYNEKLDYTIITKKSDILLEVTCVNDIKIDRTDRLKTYSYIYLTNK